jgi:phage shock protein PspC (stress-responsive transcriptional regulator)
MKRAIQINLAGTIFNIDEDAYEVLKDYLNGVESQFSRSSDGPEVIQDMEHRMAELFTDRLKPHRKVISTEDVREVLKTMGAPDDFGEKGYDRSEYRRPGRKDGQRYRRMYRDSNDKPIGGVCSGLGYYFNTDPLLIRILFVIALFMGFGFLVYLVLWIALPMAQTPEQISEMKSGSYYF